MRDPKRIDIILEELNSIWKENPDLRLGQLICNVARDPQLYYIKDEELIKLLKHFYKGE